jgi:putative redox protein
MPTVNVTVEQLDHSASRGSVRGHTLIMDRPVEKGGQNQGPLGGETLLMGLGGCFMSNLLAAAKARNIDINNARAEIAGEAADGPPRYTAIHMTVSADCSAPDELEKLVTIAKRSCIASNTLSKSVQLTVECG